MSELALEDAPVAGEVVDAASVDEALEPVDAPVAPAYDPTEDPRILELVQNQAAQIADRQFRQALAEAQAAQGGAPVAPQASFIDEFGTFDPDAFATWQAQRDEQIAARFEQTLKQVTGPMQEERQQAAIAEGEQQMRDVIADLSTREGELIGGDVAVNRIIDDVRNRWFPQVSQTYGLTNRAAEIALEKAYRAELSYQKAITDSALTQHVNRNAQLAGVRGEPGLGAGSGVPAAPAVPYQKGELSRKYSQQAQQLRG